MILFSGVSIANRAGGSAGGLATQTPALMAAPFDVVLLASAPAFGLALVGVGTVSNPTIVER